MQVQNISSTNNNPQTFQGRVCIVNDLSAVPTKYVRANLKTLQELIADKNFDLFIKQKHKKDTISIIAQKGEDYYKGKNNFTEITFNKNADFYKYAAKGVIEDYEKLPKPASLQEKCSNFFKKLGKKLFEIMTDED